MDRSIEEEKACQDHIFAIFKEYTTPSRVLRSFTNLSDTIIQTALSGQSKFLFEILQNADDAFEDIDSRIEVKFILHDSYLIVHHDGKGFDYNDVERICDYASQIEEVKATDLSKTGYKGLGFKSLFNLSDCIYIHSNGYSFRFDKTYWSDLRSKPWQVIPIWCSYNDLPLCTEYSYDQPVNFIVKLKNHNQLESQLIELVNEPELLLYLHRIDKLYVNLNREDISLERKIDKFGLFNKVHFYKNQDVLSTWLIRTYDQAVTEEVQASVQGGSRFIFPDKIKKAKSVPYTFALKVDPTFREVSIIQGLCYNTLPTQLQLTLPYHINSYFILNLDRTQLHENEWNNFLMYQIGKLHLSLLRDLAEIPYLRNYVIELLVRKIDHPYRAFSEAYSKGFIKAKSEISWLPPHKGSSLLKLGEVWTDDLEFFKQSFYDIQDPVIYPYLINYDVRGQNTLTSHEANRFNYNQLFREFSNKYYPQLTKESYKSFIIYLYEKLNCHSYYGVEMTELRKTCFLVTKSGHLVSPGNALLEESDNPIPAVLMLNPIDNEYLPLKDTALVKQWLVTLGATLLKTPIQVIRESILKWIDSNNLNLKMNVENHIGIVNYLAKGIRELTKRETEKLKDRLLILTESNQFELVKLCYLADSIPIRELRDVISKDELISSCYSMDSLKYFFIHVGVHERVNPIDVLRRSIFIWIKNGEIKDKITMSNYTPFISYIAEHYNSIQDDLTEFEKVELSKIPILTCAFKFQDAQACCFDSGVPNVEGLEYGFDQNILVSTLNVSDKVKRVFIKIGVSEKMLPKEVVRRSILRWIQEGEIDNRINFYNHNSILEYIAEHWEILKSPIGLKANEREALKKIPVLTKSEKFRAAINCYWQTSEFHSGIKRDEIPGIESIISSDELVSMDYCSTETKRLLNDLGVSTLSFIKIYENYSDHLNKPENTEWFFTHLIKYWNENGRLTTNDILLNYVQKKFKSSSCLLGENNKTYNSTSLYSSKFSNVHSIDPNSIPLFLYHERLPKDLETWLGFKSELELSCIVQLLKAVEKKPELGTSAFFTTLLEQLKLKEENEIKKYQLSLLSKSNELKLAKDLYYFIEEDATCVIASCYLKRIHDMSHDETLELAQLCGVNTLTFKQELQINPEKPNHDYTLKEFYLERLPFIVLQESTELNESPSDILKRVYNEICSIELYQCCDICVQYPFGSSDVQSHFEKLKLYVIGEWDHWKHNSNIHKYVKEQLGFKTDIAQIIDMKYITRENKQDWLCFKKEDSENFYLIEEELQELRSREGPGSVITNGPEITSHCDAVVGSICDDIIEVNTQLLVRNQSEPDSSFKSEHMFKNTVIKLEMLSSHNSGSPIFFGESSEKHCTKWLSEKHVFTFLQDHYKNKYPTSQFNLSGGLFTLQMQPSSKIEVIWENESEDKDHPYDLVLKKDGEIIRLIEVESTNLADNDSFNMSNHTFVKKISDLAIELPAHKEKYCIYRIFNVDNPSNKPFALYKVIPLRNP